MRDIFFSAADGARLLLDSQGLVRAWDRPSALPRMTTGALAAHLSRAVTVVAGYLETEAGPPYRDAPGYFLELSSDLDTDLDAPLATAVRDRADGEASQGLGALVGRWDAVRQDLEAALDEATERKGISVLGSSMLVADYLVTRTVELVVHSDDLAASVGLEPPAFPRQVTDTVVACLLEIAQRRSSPLAVIRAMTRVERATPDVLRVF